MYRGKYGTARAGTRQSRGLRPAPFPESCERPTRVLSHQALAIGADRDLRVHAPRDELLLGELVLGELKRQPAPELPLQPQRSLRLETHHARRTHQVAARLRRAMPAPPERRPLL